MRVVVLYRDKSDHGRPVTDFLRDFYHQTGHQLETMDPDSPEAQSFAETYDIVEYPTVIALESTGMVQNIWRGLPLPTISEVSYYVQSN